MKNHYSPYRADINFLPAMLMRGTKRLDYQQLQDRLDELRSQVSFSGTEGLLSANIETKREYLNDLLPLVAEIMKEPRFDSEELEVLKRQAIAGTEASMTEPNALAAIAVQRALAPYAKGDIRYVETLEERIESMRAVDADKLRELHSQQVGATRGEITAVGDFDVETLARQCDDVFGGWESSVPHARIPREAQTQVEGIIDTIETPDKANSVYYGSLQIEMRDDHPDYPALLVGNYIMGGGAMTSRLGNRVRQKEGLSYTVGSGVNAHPVDERTSLTVFAIANPETKDRLIEVINEEVQLLLQDGVKEEELAAAKQGILQSSQLERTQDGNIAGILVGTIFANRDMSYHAQFEKQVADLTVEQVNAALKKYVDMDRLVIYLAGDFAKYAGEASE